MVQLKCSRVVMRDMNTLLIVLTIIMLHKQSVNISCVAIFAVVSISVHYTKVHDMYQGSNE